MNFEDDPDAIAGLSEMTALTARVMAHFQDRYRYPADMAARLTHTALTTLALISVAEVIEEQGEPCAD